LPFKINTFFSHHRGTEAPFDKLRTGGEKENHRAIDFLSNKRKKPEGNLLFSQKSIV